MRGPAWSTALGLQSALSQACWTGVRLMTGYRALERGADPLALGVIAASFAAPALLAALPLGRFADRFGGARLSFLGIVAALIGTAGVVVVPGLWLLIASSAVVGLGHIAIMIGQQTFVAAQSRSGSPDAAFGNLTAAASIGQLIGPPAVTTAAALGILGAVGPGPDTTTGILASAVFLLLALPMFVVLRRRPVVPVPVVSDRRIGGLLRTPGLWRSLTVSAAVLVTVDLLYAFIPAWATGRGISVQTVGALLAVRALVSVVTRIGLARLVRRFGRRMLLITSVLAAAAGLVALPFVGIVGAFVAMVGLGLGLGIPQPLTMSWVVRLTEPGQHGAVLGLRMSANRLAQITLPIGVGAVAAPFGASAVFVANAALLGAALFTLPRVGMDDPPPDG